MIKLLQGPQFVLRTYPICIPMTSRNKPQPISERINEPARRPANQQINYEFYSVQRRFYGELHADVQRGSRAMTMGCKTVIRFPARVNILIFVTGVTPAPCPTEHPTQWVMGVKQPGRGSSYSHPSSDKVKNAWIYASTPYYSTSSWQLFNHCQG